MPNQINTVVGLKLANTTQIAFKEYGIYAEEVVKIAKELGIKVIEQNNLTRQMRNLEIDDQVPDHLLQALLMILEEI
jgi:type III secretion system FlhB-like substrate exporter